MKKYRDASRKKYGILIDADKTMPAVTVWISHTMWLWFGKKK
jgi:hypothetical protein